MPIDLKRYPTNWRKVSRTIRRIAGNRCEWCGVANGAALPSGRTGKVVLTVAHLDHDVHNLQRENLRCLCQHCHLHYDLEKHIRHARATRQRNKWERIAATRQLSLFDDAKV